MSAPESNESDARAYFGQMPAEVFDDYILPHIDTMGWPITSRWRPLFMHQPVEVIANLRWRMHQAPLGAHAIHPGSIDTVYCVLGRRIPRQPLHNPAGRVLFHRQWLATHGRFIKPVILQWDIEGYRILDGHHRIAALFSSPIHGKLVCDFWLGEAASDDLSAGLGGDALEAKLTKGLFEMTRNYRAKFRK